MKSLELCAERACDIVPLVFERFFELDSAAKSLMQHSDLHMQGRMFESVLDLFMSEEHLGPGNYLEWEPDNHIDAYAATAGMYESFFQALLEVVKNALGPKWTPVFQAAWENRITTIMEQVYTHGTESEQRR